MTEPASAPRLYAPSIVLVLWAFAALAIGRSTALTIIGLILTAASMVVAELERQRLRHLPAAAVTPTRASGGRRATDRPKGWRMLIRENAYRDVWLIVITALALWSVLATQTEVDQQKQGRKIALDVSCGAVSAVIDAGRSVIVSSGETMNSKLTQFLEKHGYPPQKVRQAQARVAAEEYSRQIAAAVESQSGVKGLVKKDGSLDCSRLREAAKVAVNR